MFFFIIIISVSINIQFKDERTYLNEVIHPLMMRNQRRNKLSTLLN